MSCPLSALTSCAYSITAVLTSPLDLHIGLNAHASPGERNKYQVGSKRAQ
jgi:hypothetical protein